MNEILYVQNNIGNPHFSKLFILKIIELLKNENDTINKFLNFQLYDNFFGDKEYFLRFLENLPAIAPTFPQLSEVFKTWVAKTRKRYNIKDNRPEWKRFLAYKRNYKIPGKMSEDDIKYFFTFLCEEKKGEGSYLKKEEYDHIFKNGFIIPEEPLENKYKLNYNTRRVKKAVDYGIHLLYKTNSPTQRDKNDYILFFAHYIEDYASALESYHDLELINSNMKGKRSKFWEINWDIYLKK
jgi:hypothetical protein